MKQLLLLTFTTSLVNVVFGIINGRAADIIPYQVSLQVNSVHHCGGTVISKDFILTSAHCIDSRISFNQLSILAGTLSLAGPGVRVNPAKFIPHEKYDETFPYKYDIALIKLQSSLNFTEFIAPIELLETEPAYGTVYEFSGWGWTSIGGEKPDRLQSINLTSIHPAECKNKYDIDGGPGQVCTISPRGGGPCVNDSGGPVTWEGRLFGIDSYGNSEQCDGEKPDITSSVPFHFRWIKDKMQNNI